MNKPRAAFLLAFGLFTATGCKTMEGFSRAMENVGHKVDQFDAKVRQKIGADRKAEQ